MNEKKLVYVCNKDVKVVSKTACYILRDNYVLVKPYFCGICGSDLHSFREGKCLDSELDNIGRGHEITGVVKMIGENVKTCKVGDKVTINPVIPCRKCHYCKRREYTFCNSIQLIGVNVDGGFTNKIMVPDHAVYNLGTIKLELGVLTEPTAVMVKVFRILNYQQYRKKTLIYGCGTLGLLALFLTKESNLNGVSIVAKHPFQKEKAKQIAKSLGIDINIFDYKDKGSIRRFQPDLVVETVGGSSSSLKDSLEIIKPGGTIVVTGLFNEKAPKINPTLIVTKNVSIHGSNCYNGMDFDAALKILNRYQHIMDSVMITHKFTLQDCKKGFNVASNKTSSRCVKCIIEIYK